MENDSLETLRTLIEEEIYLIPSDREAILKQLNAEAANSSGDTFSPSDPMPVSEKKAVAPVTPPTPTPKEEAQVPREEAIREPIAIRGNFSKGVLVLHEEETLSVEVMEMLVKMLKACGHSMTEVGMVTSLSLENRSMGEFENLNAHTVLKFGRIKHPINAIPARLYEVYSEKETEYLFADSLSEISEDKNLKLKLWTSLQVLFNLSPKK